MRINHNLSALNAWKNLVTNDDGQNKTLEKLSSGLRIGRAADDAAGLSISEKMRGQIKGLNQASRNAQDGISLLQTAEGALGETHSILQRMRELAVQSASDTVTNADRGEIQKEVDALAVELNRIAGTTEFNTQNLLAGNFEGKTVHIGANAGQSLTVDVSDMSAKALGVHQNRNLGANYAGGLQVGGDKLRLFGTVNTAGTEVNAVQVRVTITDATAGAEIARLDWLDTAGNVLSTDLGQTVGVSGGDTENGVTFEQGTVAVALNDAWTVDLMNQGIDVSSQTNANSAITTINSAINTVSGERSKLGAIQNRLDHTIANLATSSENLTAAESRIRDVDIAVEMMSFTKYQILSQ
ncbi:MAG: flagellin, partial [Clostridia bacterium]|nr:flagellin [Clostridia bacterium]